MDEYALDAQQRMNKTIESLRQSLSTLRTGRASPAILAGVQIDYYGSMTPISQVSSITVPEPRQLLVKPYDKNDVKAIVSAINASNLGLNPINEGTVIRLIIPALTQERRVEISKQAKKYGEEAKVAIRNIRRDYMDIIKEDDSLSEDFQKRATDDLQKVTDEAIKNIDAVVGEKEKELMSI
jgi:ribosome recycling factor